MRANGIITIMTDFGLCDGYVAAMKGVILSRFPDTRMVDVTHLVAPHDVIGGAFVLASSAPTYPVGTVHLAVVDPGVGSARLGVAVQTNTAWFVGPDNGLLSQASGEKAERVVRVETVPGTDRPVSATFHGRDLFAPAAAYLASGGSIENLGPSSGDLIRLDPTEPEIFDDGMRGQIIYIDHFGNTITNISEDDLPVLLKDVVVEIQGETIHGVVHTYSDVPQGSLCALIGSGGFLEIAETEGSAAVRLGVARGTPVTCRIFCRHVP